MRFDHPTNTKRGGAYIYCCNYLALNVLGVQFLDDSINSETKIGPKMYNFLCLYRSPSQSSDISETFANNFEQECCFELTLDTLIHKNPFLITILGDFNAQATT